MPKAWKAVSNAIIILPDIPQVVYSVNQSIISCNAVVLVNTQSSAYGDWEFLLKSWLEHYGVPTDVYDLAQVTLPQNLDDYPLIIFGHGYLDGEGVCLGEVELERIRTAIKGGSGLVSFDSGLSCRLFDTQKRSADLAWSQEIEIHPGHSITDRYQAGQRIPLVSPIELSKVPLGERLITGAERDGALLSVHLCEQGRAIHWASSEWMRSSVLGPLGGLDAAFWRGLVWAARKPFCIRGFPPVVTMRVDDVAGWGGLWQQEPLYWAEDAIRAGFKPWLGLFIYNLDHRSIEQAREMVFAGNATVFPHALGRPPREGQKHYYHPEALAPRVQSYDEFIYFDHHAQKPWCDDEAQRGLDAVETWFRNCHPLPMSRVALGHWYEMGLNTVERLRKWGCDHMGKVMDFDLALVPGTPWLRGGPFRRDETPGDALPHGDRQSGKRPVYYADSLRVGEISFFNSLTEIRDDAGYEWAPDNDVDASIARARRQLRRALDGMCMASLFTHETDFIFRIEPQRWTRIMQGAAAEIQSYCPRQMTLDEGMDLLRATRSSRLTSCTFDHASKRLSLHFDGQADRITHFYVFTSEDTALEGILADIPAFDGNLVKKYEL
jgi:hypothetical protein